LGDHLRYMMAKWVYGYGLPLRVIGYLGLKPANKLLLIGSGIGETAILAYRKRGCEVQGLEIYPQLVEQARRRAEERGLSSRLSFENLSETVLNLRCYDAVLFETILSFLPNPQTLLHEVSGFLKKGGRIGIIELTRIEPLTPIESKFITRVFGGGFSPRSDEEWAKIFRKLQLRLRIQGTERIGLAKKFWDDLSTSPISTLTSLSKTIYSIRKKSKNREMLRDYIAIMKKYNNKLVCTYYVLEINNESSRSVNNMLELKDFNS